MAYIVQANVPGSDDAASISLGDKIIGDARIYTPEELALIVADNQN
jgi:hypothetical protein